VARRTRLHAQASLRRWPAPLLMWRDPRLMVQLLGSLAEFERELIRGRVRDGLARVREKGKTRSGRPIGRPRREIDTERIVALRAEGRSWRSIAQALKVPRRTVERAARSARI